MKRVNLQRLVKVQELLKPKLRINLLQHWKLIREQFILDLQELLMPKVVAADQV